MGAEGEAAGWAVADGTLDGVVLLPGVGVSEGLEPMGEGPQALKLRASNAKRRNWAVDFIQTSRMTLPALYLNKLGPNTIFVSFKIDYYQRISDLFSILDFSF
jgi:hypothetical protein